MRKIIIFIILMLAFQYSLYSQDTTSTSQKDRTSDFFTSSPVFFDEIYVSTNIVTDGLFDKDFKNGLGVGIALHKIVPFKHNISLAVGLEYNYSRLKVHDENIDSQTFQDIQKSYFHTIDVPVLLRYTFNTNIILFIEAGGFIGSSIKPSKGQTKVYHDGIDDFSESNVVHGNTTLLHGNTFLGPQVGIGCKIPISKVDLLFKIDYRHDFMDRYYKNQYVIPLGGLWPPTPNYEYMHIRYLRLNVGIGF